MEETNKQKIIRYLLQAELQFTRADERLSEVIRNSKADEVLDGISEARIILNNLKNTKVGECLF